MRQMILATILAMTSFSHAFDREVFETALFCEQLKKAALGYECDENTIINSFSGQFWTILQGTLYVSDTETIVCSFGYEPVRNDEGDYIPMECGPE